MESNVAQQSFTLHLDQGSQYAESQHNGKFPLQPAVYAIAVNPKTYFWRLALRFFRNESDPIPTVPSQFDRNLYIGGGVALNDPGPNALYSTTQLVLGQNGLSAVEDIPSPFPYDPMSRVQFTFYLDNIAPVLHLDVTGIEHHFSFKLPDNNFKFFSLYAWSDGDIVDLEGTISGPPSAIKGTTTTTSTENKPVAANYFLIKLRDETWNTRSFEVGMDASFDSYLSSDIKRSEYPLFEKLKIGDPLIGYECESDHEIVCTFTVTSPITPDVTKVSFKIDKVIKPPIPLSHFKQKINFTPQLSNAVVTRLFEIDKTRFDDLLTRRPTNDPHTAVLTSFTSDNHSQTEDQLAFTYDILSFATVIALKTVEPPLAIGLFGNWGSGKSYFMEQLEKEIRAKAEKPGEFFMENIVHVKFNSWHYSDANLWASLISEIFEELYSFAGEEKRDQMDAITDKLKINQLQQDVATAKKVVLETRQLALTKEEDNLRKTLRNRAGFDVLKTLITDPKLQQDLATFNNQNIESVFEEAGKVQSFINEVQDEKKRWTFFFRNYFTLRGRWIWIVVVVFLVFCFSWAVQNIPAVHAFWNNLAGRVATFIIFIAGFLSKLQSAYAPVKKRFDEAYTRLVSLKETMDNSPVVESPRARELRTEIDSNQKELEDLKNQLRDLQKEKKATEQELSDVTSGRKLREFIEQKNTSELYSKQLGIISLIRKDFEQLNILLRGQVKKKPGEAKAKDEKELIEQATAPQPPQSTAEPTSKPDKLRIDRIVLYIDDLDRCNEDIVVNVLEAVHLLLAFELFVVVVGVDPRWLNKSLTKKYSFFSNNGVNKQNKTPPADTTDATEKDDDSIPISSFDYLEKIFQIPFALKPITKEGREGLIGYLLKTEIEKKEAQQNTSQSTAGTSQTGSQDQQQQQGQQTGAATATQESQANEANNGNQATVVTSADATIAALKAMTFSQEEVEYMKEVSVLFGHTPRTIKRFVNIYRLIKSNRSLDPLTDYKATLLLLAIIVGSPQHAQTFITELENSVQATFHDLISQPKLTEFHSWILRQLRDTPIPKEWRQQSIASLQANQELICRFSFRTYAM